MPVKKAQLPKNATKIRDSILSAALAVAAREPWEFVSPLSIATEAGITPETLGRFFPSKNDIVAAIIADLDAQVEDVFQTVDDDVPLRDRLFDVLMERIDIANQNRAAHISFFKAFGWTKDSVKSDVCLLSSSMRRMAKCAGMDVDGLSGGLRLAGLCAVYGWVLVTWARDTSPDLGRTMAELDRSLKRAESLAAYLVNAA